MDAQTRYEKRAYFSGKRFVPLIFHLFSIEGGARHPWQLSAIATAIATWLGALSRSHGTRAHHKGGANSGEVQKTAQGERKGCTRTWKTNAPRAHRVVHRAYVSLQGAEKAWEWQIQYSVATSWQVPGPPFCGWGQIANCIGAAFCVHGISLLQPCVVLYCFLLYAPAQLSVPLFQRLMCLV